MDQKKKKKKKKKKKNKKSKKKKKKFIGPKKKKKKKKNYWTDGTPVNITVLNIIDSRRKCIFNRNVKLNRYTE